MRRGPRSLRPVLALGLTGLWLSVAALARAAEPVPRVLLQTRLEPPSLALVSALRGGLAAWDLSLQQAPALAACAPLLDSSRADATVSVAWTHGQSVSLCFATTERFFTRELGPFEELHVRAREELVTVIEAGLETLLLSDDRDRPVGDPNAEPAMTAAPAPASPSLSRAGADLQTARARAAATHLQLGSRATPSAAYTLGFGYALAFWGSQVSAQAVTASATRSLEDGLHLHTGPQVAYVPALQIGRGDVGLLASELQMRWVLAVIAPLMRAFALEGSLGPTLSWLHASPIESRAGSIGSARSVSRFKPMLTAQLGPRLTIASEISLLAQFGCSVAPGPQLELGFHTVDGTRLSVLKMRQVRLFFEFGARIGL